MQTVDHTKNIVEVKDISFSFGNERVLENISFAVHKGDYLGVVGPNGAGKTTLLKIMLGLNFLISLSMKSK
jgi:ABC-type Mn2+/Zn2+ transport system ATPase subunit